MFPISRLKAGKYYLFRGEVLTYQSATKGLKPKVYIFKNEDGKRKEICRAILQNELWEEIENAEAITTPAKK